MDDKTAGDDTGAARSVTRRRLVKGAAGAAAVGAAAVAAVRVPALSGHHAEPVAASTVPAVDTGSLPKQDWVIYVRDADNDALDVFVGEQHFPVRDADLVARLVAAAAK
jgi:hypothetical protein